MIDSKPTCRVYETHRVCMQHFLRCAWFLSFFNHHGYIAQYNSITESAPVARFSTNYTSWAKRSSLIEKQNWMPLYKRCRQCSKNKHLHQSMSWGAKPLSMCVTSEPLLGKLWCKETHVDKTQVFILPTFPSRKQARDRWTGIIF